ncbi:hypothetical protein GUJ93_ZPchr0009g1066 [Zizania palustris]|uniref:Uncharacterized protein n=1 Tax=Zizania palustris TaxID=103762 RepID=A0A8J5RKL7_ZIZPA|nr:hypothetical protein GUJ93_ZPchr0009g1066 [Zizania palustris]
MAAVFRSLRDPCSCRQRAYNARFRKEGFGLSASPCCGLRHVWTYGAMELANSDTMDGDGDGDGDQVVRVYSECHFRMDRNLWPTCLPFCLVCS